MRTGRPSSKTYYVDGKQFDSLGEAAAANKVSKPTIHNWCKGKRPNCWMEPRAQEPKPKKGDIPDEVKDAAESANMTPLDYMLKIMRDENAGNKLRAQMAYWAAPYMHPKADRSKGKKQDKADRAREAGSGKFAAGRAPLTVVK